MKIVQIIPANPGWHVVLKPAADLPPEIRPVQCWALTVIGDSPSGLNTAVLPVVHGLPVAPNDELFIELLSPDESYTYEVTLNGCPPDREGDWQPVAISASGWDEHSDCTPMIWRKLVTP